MDKKNITWRITACLAILGLAALLLANAGHPPSEELKTLQAAREHVLKAGSFRFNTAIQQVLVPRAVTANIGESSQQVEMRASGEVMLPDFSHLQLIYSEQDSLEPIGIITHGDQTYIRNGEILKPIANPAGLSTPGSDPLVWLEGADQVAELDPANEGGHSYQRYSFTIDGPKLVEHLSAQVKRQMGGTLPAGAEYNPPSLYAGMTGTGEIWLDSSGLPYRQILEISIPELNESASARLHIDNYFSDYGKVDRFPVPVQDGSGAWTIAWKNLSPSPSVKNRDRSLPIITVSPGDSLVLAFCLMVALLAAIYQRKPRQVIFVVTALILVSVVFGPLLQSLQLVQFNQRQAEAAEKSIENLNQALGLSADRSGSPGLLSTQTPKIRQLSSTAQHCGNGSTGADTDQDTINDQAETCLGTDPGNTDTDRDMISDALEVFGFTFENKTWPSNPLVVDSNNDGLADYAEWPKPAGEALSWDPDGDHIPNLWDPDNDNDGVPDNEDISPYSRTDFLDKAGLTLSGSVDSYVYIDLQVQPQNEAHLRYSQDILDWPNDTQGQIQDLDASTHDIYLQPMLEVITRNPPDEQLASHYGTAIFDASPLPDGSIRMYLPLVPDGKGAKSNIFYTRLAYQPNAAASINWSSIKMVWIVQARLDQKTGERVTTTETPIQTYSEPNFRITGLRVERNKDFESAILAFPTTPEDDQRLFNLTFGISSAFLNHQSPDLAEIEARFTNPNTPAELLWGVHLDANDVAVVDRQMIEHSDEAIAGLSDRTRWMLDTYFAGVSNPSLILAYENKTGSFNVDQLSQTTLPGALVVSLNGIGLDTQRGLRQVMYQHTSGDWQALNTNETLAVVSGRYSDLSGALGELSADYPELTDNDLKSLLMLFYMIWTAGQTRIVSLASHPIAPNAQPDAEITMMLSKGTAASLPAYLLKVSDLGQVGAGLRVGHTLQEEWSYQSGTGDRTNTLGTGSGFVTEVVNYSRTMVPGTADYFVPKLAKSAVVAALAWRTANQAYQWAYQIGEFAEAGGSWSGRMSTGMRTLGVVGTVISVSMIWVEYGLTTDWSSRPAVISATIHATVATAVTIALFVISLNPVGAILVAFLVLAEAIVFLATLGQFSIIGTVVDAISSFFYSSDVLTELGNVNFVNFRTELSDIQKGYTVGAVFKIMDTFQGEIKTTSDGDRGDLADSSVYGEFTAVGSASSTPSTSLSASTCRYTGNKMTCSNDTWVSFYLLQPGVNVNLSVSSHVHAKTRYEECTFLGLICWDGNTYTDLPEDLDEKDRWSPATVTVDVLPKTLDDFYAWDQLKHLDRDGDGLLNTEESGSTGTGTDPSRWDTDGDGLSDKFEFDAHEALGLNMRLADQDGDGLNDSQELQAGTWSHLDDTDGDTLNDGQEVFQYSGNDWVGGWKIMLPGTSQEAFILPAPRVTDVDGDGLNDAAEKSNGTSPYAYNEAPRLTLEATPFYRGPNGRSGIFAAPNGTITVTLQLDNVSPWLVNNELELCLPDFVTSLSGGTMEGTPAPPSQAPATCAQGFRWSFTGANKLQVWQSVSTTLSMRVNPVLESTSFGSILARLPYVDSSGTQQVVTASLPVVIDLDAPEIHIATPQAGALFGGGILDYVLGGGAGDPTSWVTRVELDLPGVGNVAPAGISPWAYTWAQPVDGTVTLTARAYDLMNHASSPLSIQVNIDNTAPGVDSLLEDGAYIAARPQGSDLVLTLKGSASDTTSGLERVEVSLDGKPWRSAWTDDGAHPHSISWQQDWNLPNDPSSQGAHIFSLRAFDRAGNLSAVLERKLVADIAPPTSELVDRTFISNPPHVPTHTPVDLRGVANDIGNLEQPLRPVELYGDLNVITQSTIWFGLDSIGEDDAGVNLAWLGDFNGDGRADFAAGLPAALGGRGKVVIVSGRAGGYTPAPGEQMLAEARSSFTGISGAALGSSIRPAGDMNGDGYYDLLIGDPAQSRAFIVFGRASPIGTNQVLDSPRQNAWSVLLGANGEPIGDRLAPVRDVNHDGLDDLLVASSDRIYLLLGKPGQWPETVQVNDEAAAVISGTSEASLGLLGDTNGDYYADFAIGSGPSLYLFQGNNTFSANQRVGLSLASANKIFPSTTNNPRFAALGDVNGDGKDDFIYANGNAPILVYGGSAGYSSQTFSHLNPVASGFLAAPGDVNADGYADILAGADNGDTYLLLGSASLSPSGDLPQVQATLIGVVSAASSLYAGSSDLNGDGSGDLLLLPDPAEIERLKTQETGFGPQPLYSIGQLPAGQSGQPGLQAGRAHIVDDDGCTDGFTDGCTDCYTTIGAAIDDSISGDEIVVQPGVYPPFTIDGKDNLYIHGVNADAVFVDGNGGEYSIRLASTSGDRIANLTVRNARNTIVLQSAGVGGYVQEADRITLESILAYAFTTSAIKTDRTSTLFLKNSTLAGAHNHIQLEGATDDTLASAWSDLSAAPGIPATDAGGGIQGTGNDLLFIRGAGSTQIVAYNPQTQAITTLTAPRAVNANSAWTTDEAGVTWYLASTGTLYSFSAGTWTDHSLDANVPKPSAGTAIVSDGSGRVFGEMGGGSPWLYHSYGVEVWGAVANPAPGGFGEGAALLRVGGHIYALRGGNTPDFYRFNILDETWSNLAQVSNPANPGQTVPVGAGAGLAWDGRDWIYATPGGGGRYFLRYHIPTNTWELLGNNDASAPEDDVPVGMRAGSGLLRAGDQVYAVPGGGQPGFWSFKRIGVYPEKLKMDGVAIVGPKNATQITWINSDLIHDDDYYIHPGASSWVAGRIAQWLPDPLRLPRDKTVYASTDVPQHVAYIPSVSKITSTLTVPDSAVITNLNITGLHYYGSSQWLDVYLTAPDGTTVDAARMCPEVSTININVDDEGSYGLADRCHASYATHYWDGQNYRPTEPLSAFDGKDSQGNWTLTFDASGYGWYWWVVDLYGWSLEISTGPTLLTYDQARFADPLRGNYRTGEGTALRAGYYTYHPDVQVVPSGGDGVGTFASIQAAIDSGANRVFVQPGVYHQDFYLVSGVSVIGAGAELTVIQPDSPIQAAGVVDASLERVTLADNAGITGFWVRDGARHVSFMRNIVRGLGTGVQVSGAGTNLEVANNTLVENVTGLSSTDCAPLDVRNTIFANNTSAGLSFDEGCNVTYLHAYNDYWNNGQDISPLVPGPGEIFLDPLFVAPVEHNYRTKQDSPVNNAGNPTDPTPPGVGERVDIGYVEQGRAVFYVDDDYCAACINDNLTWNLDAFDTIPVAVQAAKNLIAGLGDPPKDPVTVGVAAGTYSGPISVPSYVRLVGSGAGRSKILSEGADAVTFDGAVNAQLSGFSILSLDSTQPRWNATIAASYNDSSGSGKSISLELLPNGWPQFAYAEPSGENLRYAQFDGSGWIDQVIDARPGYENLNSIDGVSLALDGNQRPHISYYGLNNSGVHGLHYATWDGAQWQIADLDPEGFASTSLAIDSQNRPHIAYSIGESGVRYTYWDGTQWTAPQTVEETGIYSNIYQGVSLKLDDQDRPHISYTRGDNPHGYDVRYAAWNGSAWVSQTIQSGYAFLSTSLQLDKNQSPHIAYYGHDAGLVYARYVHGEWDKQAVEAGNDGFFYLSLSLDSADNPHITYGKGTYWETQFLLRYAYSDGYSWHDQIVDDDHNSGKFASLALDASDNPYIASYAPGLTDHYYVYGLVGMGTGVMVTGASNNILIARNVLVGNQIGIHFAGRATGRVEFNTLASNTGDDILSSNVDTWVRVRNNILAVTKNGLHTQAGGQIFNDYNLVFGGETPYNDEAGTGLNQGVHDLAGQDPRFENTAAGDYDLLPGSPAVDAADPAVTVPAGGGSRADIGASELKAPPIMTWLGKEDVSAAIANSKVAGVDLGIVEVSNPSSVPTQTMPTSWTPLELTPQDRTVAFWQAHYQPEADGLYRVYSRSRDQVDNVEEDPEVMYEGAFVADSTAPVVAWVTPLSSAVSSSFELEATAADYTAGEFGVVETYFLIEEMDQIVPGHWSPEPWNFQDGLPRAFSAYLKGVGEGDYTITPYARDRAGNLGHGPAIQVTVSGQSPEDDTPPVLSISQPADGAALRGDQDHRVTFSGTVSDDASGVAGVEISLDGGVSWFSATVDGTNWSLTWSTPAGLDQVSFPLRYRASDRAGNQISLARTLSIDNTAPDGFSPVTFSVEPGRHNDAASTVQVLWSPVLDGSGTIAVKALVDHALEVQPTAEVPGNQFVANLGDHEEPWYVHLSVNDPNGNTYTRNYGPWYVGVMDGSLGFAPGSSCPYRHQSIQVDGQIDLAQNEWLASETLESDERPGVVQTLFTTWDSEGFFLGWKGSWWDIDGSLLAYLDTAPGGATRGLNDYPENLPFGAEYAVRVSAANAGSLYRYNGSGWQPDSLTFSASAFGDTEIHIPWNIAQISYIHLLAFALDEEDQARSVFPTTNPLTGKWTSYYAWEDPCSAGPSGEAQPIGRSVAAAIHTPQADQIAWGPGDLAQFDITLTNGESTGFSNLEVLLESSDGLSLESVTGVNCISCEPADIRWRVNVPSLAAHSSLSFSVTGRVWASLGQIENIWVSVQANQSAYPAEVYRHPVDGQEPSVEILTLPGSALGPGIQTVSGTALDIGPAGLDRVEIQPEGEAAWSLASGSSFWSITIQVPDQPTFTLKARAVDGSGNLSAETSVTFYVDQVGPTAGLSLPPVVGGMAIAQVSGTASDPYPGGAEVARVEVQFDTQDSPWAPATVYTLQNGEAQNWMYTWLLPYASRKEISLRVRAVDRAGNIGIPSDWQTTLVDTVPPALSVTQLQTQINIQDYLPGGSGTAVLEGSVSDPGDLSRLEVILQDPSGNSSVQALSHDNGTWQYVPRFESPQSGSFTLYVEAVDGPGNRVVAGPYKITILDQPIQGLQIFTANSIMAGDEATFKVTVTSGTNILYTWDFGNGTSAVGEVVSERYDWPGTYKVIVNAANSAGSVQAATQLVVLPREDLPGDRKEVYLSLVRR